MNSLIENNRRSMMIAAALTCITSPAFAAYNGVTGPSVVVSANGQAQFIDLRGGDGSSGQNGRTGRDGYSCTPGENGEDGESGGNGGDGGTLTFYAASLANLASIAVDQSPGAPGYGGRGGVGGRPPAYGECVEEQRIIRHDANTGRDVEDSVRRTIEVAGGSEGHDGNTGYGGSYGSLWIVSRAELLPAEAAVVRLTSDDLSQGLSKHLIHNVWVPQTGATQLFARGSRIRDTYNLFSKTLEQNVSVLWSSQRAIGALNGNLPWVQLTDTGAGLVSSDDITFIRQSQVLADGSEQIVIQDAVSDSDLRALKIDSLAGSEAGAWIILSEASGLGAKISSKISIKLSEPAIFNTFKKFYEAEVPANLVRYRAGQILIAAGQLPKLDVSKLKKGKDIRIELNLDRSMAGRSGHVQLVEHKKF